MFICWISVRQKYWSKICCRYGTWKRHWVFWLPPCPFTEQEPATWAVWNQHWHMTWTVTVTWYTHTATPLGGCTCVSGCDFHLKLHPCAHAGPLGPLAAMSPCMLLVCWHMCVCVLDQANASLYTVLAFQWSTVQPFQQGRSSCEVLNKNWQDKFACWVYRVCTLNAPRGFWEIKSRINLILFFCWKPSFCSMYTVLDNLGQGGEKLPFWQVTTSCTSP